MICKACGQETIAGNFCEHCGAASKLPRPGFLARHKVLLIMGGFLVIVAAALFIAVRIGADMYSPDKEVDKYLKALQAKNYGLAFQYVDTAPKPPNTLDKEAFIAWQKSEEDIKGTIKSFEVNKNTKINHLDATVLVDARRSKNDAVDNFEFKLISVGKNNYFFPKWKIVLPKEKVISFNDYEGAKLYLDGRDTGISFPKIQVDYKEMLVFAGKHYYEIKAPKAKPQIMTNEKELENVYLQPIDEIAQGINVKVDALAKNIMTAYNSNNPDLVEPMGFQTAADLKYQMKDLKAKYSTFASVAGKPKVFNYDMLSTDRVRVDVDFRYITPNNTIVTLPGRLMIFIQKDGQWACDLSERGRY